MRTCSLLGAVFVAVGVAGQLAYTISSAFFAQVDALVTNAVARGFHVLVNVHHFQDFTDSAIGIQMLERLSRDSERPFCLCP